MAANEDDEEDLSLVDELGIEDLGEVIFVSRGHLFSAAGRESPVAEIQKDSVLLRPPQKPLDENPAEEEKIIFHVDERGILLNELGEKRKISGCRFRGKELWVMGETKPGTLKHYAAWFDDEGQSHKVYVRKEPLTSDMVFRIRNRTHDGEISIFPEITTDGDPEPEPPKPTQPAEAPTAPAPASATTPAPQSAAPPEQAPAAESSTSPKNPTAAQALSPSEALTTAESPATTESNAHAEVQLPAAEAATSDEGPAEDATMPKAKPARRAPRTAKKSTPQE